MSPRSKQGLPEVEAEGILEDPIAVIERYSVSDLLLVLASRDSFLSADRQIYMLCKAAGLVSQFEYFPDFYQERLMNITHEQREALRAVLKPVLRDEILKPGSLEFFSQVVPDRDEDGYELW